MWVGPHANKKMTIVERVVRECDLPDSCGGFGRDAITLGWEERADEHFALSCEFHGGKGMRLWAARAHLGWAEALAGRGETERAHAEAARALELSREHGYGAIEARALAIVETGSAARS